MSRIEAHEASLLRPKIRAYPVSTPSCVDRTTQEIRDMMAKEIRDKRMCLRPR